MVVDNGNRILKPGSDRSFHRNVRHLGVTDELDIERTFVGIVAGNVERSDYRTRDGRIKRHRETCTATASKIIRRRLGEAELVDVHPVACDQ